MAVAQRAIHDALARLTTDGTLDNTFDSDGKLTTDFGYDDYASGMTIGADGSIIVVGQTWNHPPGTTGEDLAMAGYTGQFIRSLAASPREG